MVSTDGSCLKNPGGAIGWAWVDHRGEARSGGAASGTNQIAELRAVLEAVVAHPGEEPLMIESDSQYAIKCATEWLPGWKKRGWKTAGGSPVKNVELIRAIDGAITERTGPVRFRWVRGHVGNEFNEMADSLAGKAARAARDGKIMPTPAPGVTATDSRSDRSVAVDAAPEADADPTTDPDPAAGATPGSAPDAAPAAAGAPEAVPAPVPAPAAAAPAVEDQPALFGTDSDDELTLF